MVMIVLISYGQDKVFAPALVSPADNATNQVVNVIMDWTAVAGAQLYELQYDTDVLFTNPDKIFTTFSAANAQELKYFTVYYWRVRAIGNPGDTSAWSGSRSLKTVEKLNLILPKDVVTPNNTVIGITTTSDTIQVNITPPNTNYLVTSPDSSISIQYPGYNMTLTIVDNNTISFINDLGDTLLLSPPDTTFSVIVANYSSPVSLILPNNTFNFNPADTAKYSFNIFPIFRWQKISGSTNYLVQIDTTAGFNSPYLKTITTADKDTVIRHLDYYGQGYYYRVSAFHSRDTSAWSEMNYFSTMQKPVLERPLPDGIGNPNLNVTPIVELQWNAIAGSTGFDYEYSVDSTFATSHLVHVPYFAYTLENPDDPITRKGLVKTNADVFPYGETIFWRARSISDSDTSLWSDPFWLTTIPTVIINSPANGATDVSLTPTLNFRKINGSEEYQVQLSKFSDFSEMLKDSIMPHPQTVENLTLAVFPALEGNTNYYWRARAISVNDISDWNEVTFKTMSDVSISSFSLENNFSFYPNPTTGKLYIEVSIGKSSDYNVEISNVIGQVVTSRSGILNPGENKINMNLTEFENGIYFLTFSVENQKLTKKLILSK